MFPGLIWTLDYLDIDFCNKWQDYWSKLVMIRNLDLPKTDIDCGCLTIRRQFFLQKNI